MPSRTQIIQTYAHSNSRTEFHLDSSKVYQNLRIIDLGCTVTGGPFAYPDNSGVYSLINNIYLMDGSTVLDQLTNAHLLLAFQNLQAQCGEDYSLHSYLKSGSRSYELNYPGTLIAGCPTMAGTLATDDSYTTFRGILTLARCFPLLTKLPALDTSVFMHLRVVIEWRTSLAALAGNTAAANPQVLQPQLLADEVLNADGSNLTGLPDKKYSVMFPARICELANVAGAAAAPGADTASETNILSRAFVGRNLIRLLLVNTDDTFEVSVNANDSTKNDISAALTNEVFQINVNGKNLLNFNGCDTIARKCQLLVDAWGDYKGPNKIGMLYYENQEASLATMFEAPAAVLFFKIASYSYGGLMVGQRVNDMTINVKRTLTANDFDPISLYMFGEVSAGVAVDGNSYTVSYL